MKRHTLHDLFIDQLRDTYDAEKQLVKALPKLAKVASSPDLQEAFTHHLEETERQIERLEKVFEAAGYKAKSKTCEAMKGLVEEGKDIMDWKAEPDVLDAGLIAAAQKVEHYEIASYGCLCTWAEKLGYHEGQRLLHETLEEEKHADEKLTQLAQAHINEDAAATAGAEVEANARAETAPV